MQVSNISFCNNYNSFLNSQPEKSLDEFISDEMVADIEDRANAPCKYHPLHITTSIIGHDVNSLSEVTEYAKKHGFNPQQHFPECDLDLYI
ncbi:MAG: hypothetical protein IJ003_06330 [Candidatus Gastranaerophilales bacterium]|nr:hypothetical protein [Candidatus Gastranaerophilales bacterium]